MHLWVEIISIRFAVLYNIPFVDVTGLLSFVVTLEMQLHHKLLILNLSYLIVQPTTFLWTLFIKILEFIKYTRSVFYSVLCTKNVSARIKEQSEINFRFDPIFTNGMVTLFWFYPIIISLDLPCCSRIKIHNNYSHHFYYSSP